MTARQFQFRLLLRVVVVSVGLSVVGFHPQAQSLPVPLTFVSAIEGVYTVSGTNPNSSRYVGVLEIKDASTHYLFRWTMTKTATGWREAYGYGYLTAQGNLVVVIQDDMTGGLVLADYHSPERDTWVGSWSPVSSGLIGSETLTKSTESAETLREQLPKEKDPVRDTPTGSGRSLEL
jgi:hypothetical protein